MRVAPDVLLFVMKSKPKTGCSQRVVILVGLLLKSYAPGESCSRNTKGGNYKAILNLACVVIGLGSGFITLLASGFYRIKAGRRKPIVLTSEILY